MVILYPKQDMSMVNHNNHVVIFMHLFIDLKLTKEFKKSGDCLFLCFRTFTNNLVARFSGILAVGIIGGVFAMIEDGTQKFQVSAIIMAVSSSIGTLYQ